jgi:hypothetical protein
MNVDLPHPLGPITACMRLWPKPPVTPLRMTAPLERRTVTSSKRTDSWGPSEEEAVADVLSPE